MMADAESVSFRIVFGLVSYVVFDHDDEDDDVDGDLGFKTGRDISHASQT
jgi:hypothetical protein